MILSSRGVQTSNVIRIDKTVLRWLIIISFPVEHYDAIAQACKEEERKILQKTEEEKEAIEIEKLKTKKERKKQCSLVGRNINFNIKRSS